MLARSLLMLLVARGKLSVVGLGSQIVAGGWEYLIQWWAC